MGRNIIQLLPPPVVREIPGEPLRFHVSSRRIGHGPYLVDLSEFKLQGACGCEHFEFQLRPLLASGKPLLRPCYHVQVARQYFCNLMLARVNEAVQACNRKAVMGV